MLTLFQKEIPEKSSAVWFAAYDIIHSCAFTIHCQKQRH